MKELSLNEIELVNGQVALGLWALFLTGYGSGAFEKIDKEIGAGLYDAINA